jgi:hypothetical protein
VSANHLELGRPRIEQDHGTGHHPRSLDNAPGQLLHDRLGSAVRGHSRCDPCECRGPALGTPHIRDVAEYSGDQLPAFDVEGSGRVFDLSLPPIGPDDPGGTPAGGGSEGLGRCRLDGLTLSWRDDQLTAGADQIIELPPEDLTTCRIHVHEALVLIENADAVAAVRDQLRQRGVAQIAWP